MNTQVNVALDRKAMSVNGGVVRPAEVPMWLGNAVLPDGSRQVMSVTYDRTYIWLRFAVGQLPDTMHALFNSLGWNYSKRKRLGYWCANPTMEHVKFVRGLGFHMAPLPDDVPPAPVETKTTQPMAGNNVAYESEVVYRHPAVRLTTTATETGNQPKYKLNKAGRWMDAVTGKLAANDDVAEWLAQRNGTHRNGIDRPTHVTQPVQPQVNYLTYQSGFDDGNADGEDLDVPDTYSRLQMAQNNSTTVAKLLEVTDSDYIDGYLDGFKAARPPAKTGSRLSQRLHAGR